MHSIKPNGTSFISLRDWTADQVQFVKDLIAANDRRYEERWISQQEAIHKSEQAQFAYNTSHNDLIRENKKISDEFSAQLEKLRAELIGHTIYTSDQRRLDDRLAVIDKSIAALIVTVNSHLQLPIHPGAQVQLDDIKKEQQRMRDLELASEGRTSLAKEQRSQRNWSVGMVITVTFGILSILISLALVLMRLAGI